MVAESLVVIAWVLVHLFAGPLRWLARVPRSRWLSFAGGVSVAYVFVHLLPQLAAADESVQDLAHASTWLLALAGLVLFYGLERWIRARRPPQQAVPDDAGAPPRPMDAAFRLHVAVFALYNGVIAYLLHHREAASPQETLLFGAALGLHFMVNDFSLRTDHAHAYDRFGRWWMAAALLAGFVLGFLVDAGGTASRALLALVAGGIVLNALKEELPEQRESRFLPFLVGAAAYATMLVAME